MQSPGSKNAPLFVQSWPLQTWTRSVAPGKVHADGVRSPLLRRTRRRAHFEESRLRFAPNVRRDATITESNACTRRIVMCESGSMHEQMEAPSNSEESMLIPKREGASQCGFAALLGPSNSGKSTLLNLLVGAKVAIVTPKVQTTRCRVAGIVTKDDTMIIYLDTPGVFEPNGRLGRAMVGAAWSSAKQGDVVSVIVDAAELYHRGKTTERGIYVSKALESVLRRIPTRGPQFCICLNKIDTVPEDEVPLFINRFRELLHFLGVDKDTTIFPMSALNNSGVDQLVQWVTERMPSGPWLYPDDDLTDMPMRLLAAEVTREKLFLKLKQEIPYEIAVNTTEYTERSNGSISITQDILVRRKSQRPIVLGHGGSVIKSIGIEARKDIGELAGCTVHLFLNVKVRGHWKEDQRAYDQWGLDYNS